MAEIRSSQSQLHNVSGLSKSGDRIILPLSKMSEVSGSKDSYTFSKMIRNDTSFQESSVSMKEELRTKATSTSADTVKEFRQVQEPSLSSKQGGSQPQPEQ